MAVTELLSAFAVMFPLLAGPAMAGSIADIEHVVLFMQGTIFYSGAKNYQLILGRESCFRSLLRYDGWCPRIL